MTPQKQRIAIAEACGLTNVVPVVIRNVRHQGDDITVRISSDSGQVPDYIYDLNAMHDAEKFILSTDLYIQYVNYLFRSVGLNRTYYMGATPEVFPADRQFAVFHATAGQRAEAFLRTIGKWEEAK